MRSTNVVERPSGRQNAWAASLRNVAGAGATGFLLGAIATAITSRSTLAPLAGFIQTGPICALGVLFHESSQHANTRGRSAILGLAAAWTLTLLYALMMLRISPSLAGSAVAVEMVGVYASVVGVWRITEHKRVIAAGGTGLTLGAFVVATLAIPALKATGGFAGFVLYLDTRFSARYHTPLLSIDWRLLASEWTLLLLIGATVAYSIRSINVSHHGR
jgi:hypothetical protein